MQNYIPFDVGCNQDGRLEVFRATAWNAASHTYQVAPNSGWIPWESGPLGGTIGPIAAARNADGRIEVFYPGSDGVRHGWQTAPNNGWYPACDSVGLPRGRCDHLYAVSNADGRLEVFRLSYADPEYPRGALWHIWQTAPNNGWSQPERIDLGTATVQRGLGCFMGPNGRLELWYTNNATNNVARQLGLTANGWREQYTLTLPAMVTSLDMQTRDGVRHVWTPVKDHDTWYIRRIRYPSTGVVQTTDMPGSINGEELRCFFDRWGNEHHFQISGWRTVPGSGGEVEALLRWACYSPGVGLVAQDATFLSGWGTARGRWRVVANQDGRLEVFAGRSDGTIWHRWQATAGQPAAGWSGWAQL